MSNFAKIYSISLFILSIFITIILVFVSYTEESAVDDNGNLILLASTLHFLHFAFYILLRLQFVYLKYTLELFSYPEDLIAQTLLTSRITLAVLCIFVLISAGIIRISDSPYFTYLVITIFLILAVFLFIEGLKLVRCENNTIPMIRNIGIALMASVIIPPILIFLPLFFRHLFDIAEYEQEQMMEC